jgi:imidazolonepropionase-like amidohydrolase
MSYPSRLDDRSNRDHAEAGGLDPDPRRADHPFALTVTMIGNAARAYKAGVKIALGTDQSTSSGRNKAEEFALLVRAGLTPIDAIFTSTKNAAALTGTPGTSARCRPGGTPTSSGWRAIHWRTAPSCNASTS